MPPTKPTDIKALNTCITLKNRTFRPKGSVDHLPPCAAKFVRRWIQVCKPGGVFICSGSDTEADDIIRPWITNGIVKRLGPRQHGLLFRSHPQDTGRAFESKTFFASFADRDKYGIADGYVKGATVEQLGRLEENFRSSMEGRRMYVIPFYVGAKDHSESGVLLTDCAYVYMAMRTEVRIAHSVWDDMALMDKGGFFMKLIHSAGRPRPSIELVRSHWPCNPSEAFLSYDSDNVSVKSYGSGVLDPTTCLFPLLLNEFLKRKDSCTVSRFSILSITTPHNREFYVAMAMADGCDDTLDLAESKQSLPGYSIEIIAMNRMTYVWTDNRGVLRAVNPMVGFSGPANHSVNRERHPMLLKTLRNSRTLFLNAALKDKTECFWDGMGHELSNDDVISDWRGLPWCHKDGHGVNCSGSGGGKCGGGCTAAHPDCRYHCYYSRYQYVHPRWSDPDGFPLSAIIFGGKRTPDVPLVFECSSWVHGILTGACLKTEGAPHKKVPKAGHFKHRDPMATKHLIQDGVLGKYLRQWLTLGNPPSQQVPRIFHVNWWAAEKLPNGNNIGHETWPGMKENMRILDWILRRCDDHPDIALPSPLGYIPRPETIDMKGLANVDLRHLLAIRKEFWLPELRDDAVFLEHQEQEGYRVPPIFFQVLKKQEETFAAAKEGDLDLKPRPCNRLFPDRCYACLGPPLASKTANSTVKPSKQL